MKKHMSLSDLYRIKGTGSTGSPKGNRLYQRGIRMGSISDKYDRLNYEYFYDFQEHNECYERRGLKFFLKAAKLFKRAAECNHDLATMNYGLYLYTFEYRIQESLPYFIKASELGLAVADYQLSMMYKKGCRYLAADEEKSKFYMEQYNNRVSTDERQRVLANVIDKNGGELWKTHLYDWFHGVSILAVYDTPDARPSRWRF